MNSHTAPHNDDPRWMLLAAAVLARLPLMGAPVPLTYVGAVKKTYK